MHHAIGTNSVLTDRAFLHGRPGQKQKLATPCCHNSSVNLRKHSRSTNKQQKWQKVTQQTWTNMQKSQTRIRSNKISRFHGKFQHSVLCPDSAGWHPIGARINSRSFKPRRFETKKGSLTTCQLKIRVSGSTIGLQSCCCPLRATRHDIGIDGSKAFDGQKVGVLQSNQKLGVPTQRSQIESSSSSMPLPSSSSPSPMSLSSWAVCQAITC